MIHMQPEFSSRIISIPVTIPAYRTDITMTLEYASVIVIVYEVCCYHILFSYNNGIIGELNPPKQKLWTVIVTVTGSNERTSSRIAVRVSRGCW